MFGVLSNEARLAILLALCQDHNPLAADNSLSFTALRKQVGTDDSGQFNYHLDKIPDRFVEATEEGYTLRRAGHKIIHTVVAGIDPADTSLDTADLDVPCPRCSTPLLISYEDRQLQITCPGCATEDAFDESETGVTLASMDFDPAGIAGRTAADALLATGTREMQKNAMRLTSVCPECSGVVDSWFAICEKHREGTEEPCSHCGYHDRIQVRFVCTVCKDSMRGPASIAGEAHPAGQAFCAKHGLPFGFEAGESDQLDRLIEAGESFDHEQERISEAPLQVEVSLIYEDDDIRFLFNEAVEVLEVYR